MDTETEYLKETEDAYDRIVDVYKAVEFDKITVLTGSNGSGKSLIRKQLPFLMKEHLGLEDTKDVRGLIRSTSMDARTGSNPEWGAMAGIMRDTEWIATSQNTFGCLQGLFKSIEKDDNVTKYLVIDEFEVGCGEETVLALVNYINKRIKKLIKTTQLEGAMIITHSRIGVERLKCDNFVNMEGMSKEEWLNREIVPTDLKKLEENELFRLIRDVSNKERNQNSTEKKE